MRVYRVVVLGSFLLPFSLPAQTLTPEGIEVRRAVPVQQATPTPAPEREIPTAPAVPFDASPPRQNPAWMELIDSSPTPTPEPQPEPRSEPAAEPAASPESEPALQEGEGVGMSPETTRDPALRQLEVANGFYARKAYDLAIPEYEKFLVMRSRPGAERRDEALFRLAESQRFQGNDRAAQQTYENLVKEFDTGEYVGSGAFRLAETVYAARRYGEALKLFETARNNVKDSTVQATALFYQARALDNLDSDEKAAELYRHTLKDPEAAPFHSFARVGLAEIAQQQGRNDEAADLFLEIAETAEKPGLRAEALVKAAHATAGQDQPKAARKLYQQALDVKGADEWHPIARLGDLRMAYELNDYPAITRLSNAQIDRLPGEALPEALLILANAHRQQGNHERATELYDRLMREFPGAKAVEGARFHRLVSLYTMGAPNALEEIDEFLLVTTDPEQRNQAYLLKAELLFRDEDYEKAAQLYELLQDARLSDELKADSLFKLGWAQAQQQQYGQARASFTNFLSLYPDHPRAASALAQRALAAVQGGEIDVALRDFDQLIENYPDASERELAMQQKGLLLGQQGDTEAMTTAFSALLEAYPETAAAGQAQFWLGWADFEAEKYREAIPHLEKARELDPEQYQQRATVRLMLAHYYLDEKEAVAQEVARVPAETVPGEISRWLGLQYYEEGDFARADDFLTPIAEGDPSRPIDSEILLTLAEARIKRSRYEEAQRVIDRLLEQARDPVSRARGLMAYARALQGRKQYDEAVNIVEEAMLLQPEGKYNAEARMLNGEILLDRGQPEKAGRLFMTVAVLHNDPQITPQALLKAHAAFRRAGNALESKKAVRELLERFPDSAEAKELSGA